MTKKQVDALLGQNIRKARTACGLSTEELSELIGCTPGSVGLMERGKRGATTLTLAKLSEIFGHPPGDFFKNNQEEEPINETQKARKRLLSLINDFTEDELGLAAYIIKGLRQHNRVS